MSRGWRRAIVLSSVAAVLVVTAVTAVLMVSRDLRRREPGFPTYEDLAADPIFGLDLDGADPQPMYGETGTGRAGSPLGDPSSRAARRWTSSTLDARELFLLVVDRARQLGVRFERVNCHEERAEFSAAGEKRVDLEDQALWAHVLIFPVAAAPATEIGLELSVGEGEDDQSRPRASASPPAVEGNCRPDLVAVFE